MKNDIEDTRRETGLQQNTINEAKHPWRWAWALACTLSLELPDELVALLGITRWDMLDLMVQRQIPSGPETTEEMRREIADARRYKTVPSSFERTVSGDVKPKAGC